MRVLHRLAALYNCGVPTSKAVLTALALAGIAAAQKHVSFPTQDGGLIHADLYGDGERGVVLAHGAQFEKSSWAKQAAVLSNAGFRALAIDFRGYGESRGGAQADRYLDVLAAVDYLRHAGCKTVSVLAGSMGAAAAADASAESAAGAIDRLVLLAPAPIREPGRLKGRKLFISSRGDPRAAGIRQQFEAAPDPKQLVWLEGSAHAQHIFATDQGERLMREILQFLAAP